MRLQYRNGRWHALNTTTYRLVGSFKTLAEAKEDFPAAEVRW
jgi:hypothetical protein